MGLRIQWRRLMLTTGGSLVLSSGSSVAQWPIGVTVRDTPHNLTVPAKNVDPDMRNRVADYDEICVYCHTPHGGNTGGALWNRPTPSGPYRMFEAGNMPADPQPTGNSILCLSCHDGTVGLDVILNPPNTFLGPTFGQAIDECEGCHSGGNPDGGIDWEGVWLDTDLRGQHPISVIYDPLSNPDFRTAAEVEAAGLKLYDGRVQCMTCHEPHSQQFRPFLRSTNAGNALCLICHRTQPVETTAHHW